ncbi:MAG: winged helix-turn-helix domain-containing protein [Oligoflexia bacterium]|nr:winged helix-turn-helix domain-containing protein [Oligoflexia bacterium]
MKKLAENSQKKPDWTFLSNHGHVFICLYSEPELPLKEIAIRVGITERAVHKILSDLEHEGYIKRTRIGRKNHYTFELNKQLRHPIEAHTKIKALLDLV